MIVNTLLQRPITVSVALIMSVALTGCSDMNTFMDDLQTRAVTAVPSQSALQVNTVTSSSSQPTSKTDLVGLLKWFEDSCGFTEMAYRSGTEEYKRMQAFNMFEESFMGKRSQADGSYTLYVKPDYRQNLPALLTNAIKDISVVQDSEGVHYYVDFKGATYRGYDLSRLELFYQPETDYVYNSLYFGNNNFMELQPIFKTTKDDLDIVRGGEFDAQSRSVMCYLGL